ncbi:hypothetical protein TorRG33x02_036280 [Trema orientale]|uniref:Uncharacterized protein n=1 Tax=Trema orientale TaxID=63057 RepID=A0A2P5FS15_TREOI|nr:hypothetical protein TorRG33x02_036280 [Trema orientale]
MAISNKVDSLTRKCWWGHNANICSLNLKVDPFRRGPCESHVCGDFITHFGYWDRPKLSNCFSPKAIETICQMDIGSDTRNDT